MSGPTRPIPISHGHRSQRSSPPGSSADAGVSPNGMISQSCPVNRNGSTYFHQRPPRAPVIGSLPEPSFLLAGGANEMPELILPPPVPSDSGESTPRQPSVIQVASSCPGDIGFLRHGSPATSRSWMVPTTRAPDEFDLSKSPALAVMSAMRQARRSSIDRTDDAQQRHPSSHNIPQSRRIPDSPYRPPPSNSFVSSSHFLFEEEDDDTNGGDPHDISMENLSLSESSSSSSSSSESGASALPPRRPERRGSYDGGIFHFEDSD